MLQGLALHVLSDVISRLPAHTRVRRDTRWYSGCSLLEFSLFLLVVVFFFFFLSIFIYLGASGLRGFSEDSHRKEITHTAGDAVKPS